MSGCSACGRTQAEAGRLFPSRAGGRGGSLCEHCVSEAAMAMEDAPTRIPGASHACDFCGKAEDHVGILIAIGTRKVCDECIDAYRA